MPIADCTLFKRIWPPERHPASRSATNSSLSVSKLHCQDCQRGRPTTGGPCMLISLVIDWSHCPCISLPPPPKKKRKKKEGPTWETHDWPVISCNESCIACPPPSPLLLVSGGSFSPVGGSRLERCQSTSRHGTCCCYAQSSH